MNVRVSFGLALFLAVSALSLSGLPGNADAATLNHNGAICRNYNASQVGDIDYLVQGVRNLNAVSRYVICPVLHALWPVGIYSVSVYVNGAGYAGNTVSCTLYSSDLDGNLLESQSFIPVTGAFSQYLNVAGELQDSASVLCLLPGNTNGVIYSLESVIQQ